MSAKKPELSSQEVAEISEWFKFFDKNGDKKLDKDEVSKVFTALGWELTEAEKDKVFQDTDVDKSGYIEYDEYLSLIKSLQKDFCFERMELLEKFRKIDTDHSGHISEKEMKRCLNGKDFNLSDKDKARLDTLMKEATSNGDGLVNIADFVDLMLKNSDIDALKSSK